MTLKEKIKDVDIEKGMFDRIEQIADDYAIEFAEWLEKSGHLICLIKGSMKTNKLLEIYKKEKGL